MWSLARSPAVRRSRRSPSGSARRPPAAASRGSGQPGDTRAAGRGGASTMDLGLRDKTFVVGGASRGLGRAIATELVAEGARVILMARNLAALEDVAADLGDQAT